MIINTNELDKFALPAAVGACGALALSCIVPPLAIVAASALAYGGVKAYKVFGVPDCSCLRNCCKKPLKPRKDQKPAVKKPTHKKPAAKPVVRPAVKEETITQTVNKKEAK